MGLLNGIIVIPNTGSVVVRSSQGAPFVFKTTESVVVRSSQGRFFLFVTCPGSEKVIFGNLLTRHFDLFCMFPDVVIFHNILSISCCSLLVAA